MPSRIAAHEDAAAEEGAFERVIAVVSAAAEAGELARPIEAGDRLAGGVEHLAVEIGVQAASVLRATGGVVNATFVFVLPGSPGACKDAWDGIIMDQLDYRHMPCNFVGIMPRLDEHLRRGGKG